MLHYFNIIKLGRESVFQFLSILLSACQHAALFMGALGKSCLKVSGSITVNCLLQADLV